MRLIAKAFGLVLVLLTTGCLVETENTLADPDPKAMDDRLVGTWYAAEAGEVTLFTAIADEQAPGKYRVVYASVRARAGADKPVEFEQYSVWRTVIDGKVFLNVVPIGGSTKTMIAAYDIGADGRLMLRLMDTKYVAAAVDAGKLKGTVKKGQYADQVNITASRAELAAFVAAADRDALFAAKTGLLQKLPDTRN